MPEIKQLSSTTIKLNGETRSPIRNGEGTARSTQKIKIEPSAETQPLKGPSRRIPNAPKSTEVEELPHSLGKRFRANSLERSEESRTSTKKLKGYRPQVNLNDADNNTFNDNLTGKAVHDGSLQMDAPPKKQKKGKKESSYGHTPGATPFPDYARPTPEECREVVKLLSSVHGKVSAPQKIQQGSLTVAGCGEVPHVLEALIRTRLSANTNNENSNRAFQGIVKTFGTVTDREGRTMVDWNAVRLAPQSRLKAAIEKGGLANIKSGDIKRILDMVYEENQKRRTDLLSSITGASGENLETKLGKENEIAITEDDLLSLDHLHLLPQEEAFKKLISYPGIGAKTASCVLLFCLQRPSFAVDTHIWRLCCWLGWVPKNASRDQTFSHCEVRIPDELKYPLHYLLIKHGKQCSKCQAKINKGKQNPNLGDNCVIEHLVERFNHKNGSPRKPKRTPTKSASRAKYSRIHDDSDFSSELSDLGSD
ncbi:hypothetical protein, variant 1 [Verruconis gallopava]|uniref:HhH-GPD domain-containing protein n=1 Tax=Verruconis gallopava TaxID=253628 RepID=A0A0D1Z8S8_9PEZI|nr:hypothetical protein, variant 1 [Verruconis gallopava]KIW09407.1 hypothetical protein, variant 1 [Verruconis gallopava]